MELVQVRLLVDDFGVMFRFYRDVLGLTPQANDDRGPYGKLSLPTGRAAIALQSRAHFAETMPELGAGSAERFVIAIQVADLDETVRELRARGARLVAEPSIAWGRMKLAHLRDPERNLLELQQWLAAPA
ncbi:MAG TPA: VOC family protein [Polyangiaceae bacterium]|nr:VOC family protein [Polyangiaceae bacterium]